MIEIYIDQESDFIHILQNKQALRCSYELYQIKI